MVGTGILHGEGRGGRVLSERPILSAIVVDHGTADLARRCALSLRSSFPQVEILCVRSLGPMTAEGGDEVFDALVPVSGNPGYGACCNMGARAAAGDVLLFCNGDLQFHDPHGEAWLEALLRRPSLAALGCRLVGADGGGQPSWGAFPRLGSRGGRPLAAGLSPPGLRDVDWVSGAALLCRRSAFEELGGFDEGFFLYFEDVDLGKRLRAAAWLVAAAPWYSVIHLGKAAFRRSGRSSGPAYHAGKERYFRIHRPAWESWVLRGYRLLRFLRARLALPGIRAGTPFDTEA